MQVRVLFMWRRRRWLECKVREVDESAVAIWLRLILIYNASTVAPKNDWLQMASMDVRFLCFLGDLTKKVPEDQEVIAVEIYSFDEMLFAVLLSLRNWYIWVCSCSARKRKVLLLEFDAHMFMF